MWWTPSNLYVFLIFLWAISFCYVCRIVYRIVYTDEWSWYLQVLLYVIVFFSIGYGPTILHTNIFMKVLKVNIDRELMMWERELSNIDQFSREEYNLWKFHI
jgi:hypothetical protein